MIEVQRITQSHAEGTAARLGKAIAEAVKWPGGRGPDLTLMTPEELPAELTERVQAHNSKAGQSLAALRKLPDELRAGLAAAGLDVAKLRRAVGTIQGRRLKLLAQLVDLIARRGVLAAEAGAAMKLVIAAREAKLAEAREITKAELRAAGITAESMPSYHAGANVPAAEIQLGHRIGEAAEVKARQGAVEEAKAEQRRLYDLGATRTGEGRLYFGPGATAQDMAAPEGGLRKALAEITTG